MERKVNTPYGKMRIYSQGDQKASERIMVVPGFSESLSHNRGLVDTFASLDYSAFTFSQPTKKARASSTVLDRNAPHDTFWMHPQRTAYMVDALIKSIHKANFSAYPR